MDRAGQLFGQDTLGLAGLGVLALGGGELGNARVVQEGEDAQVTDGIGVERAQEELVEGVDARLVAVEEDGVAGGLAELLAVGIAHQGDGEAVDFGLGLQAADEVGAGGDVAPLVGAAHLQGAAILLIKMVEVVALENLVGELREGHGVRLRVQTLLDGILGQHGLHAEEGAHLAQEGKDGVVLVPIIVVHHDGRVGRAVEVEEAREVFLDALQILLELLHGEEVTLGGTAGRVADHARGAANEGNHAVARALELSKGLDGNVVARLKARGGGVKADVQGERLLEELAHALFGAGGGFDQMAGLEEIVKLHRAILLENGGSIAKVRPLCA